MITAKPFSCQYMSYHNWMYSSYLMNVNISRLSIAAVTHLSREWLNSTTCIESFIAPHQGNFDEVSGFEWKHFDGLHKLDIILRKGKRLISGNNCKESAQWIADWVQTTNNWI